LASNTKSIAQDKLELEQAEAIVERAGARVIPWRRLRYRPTLAPYLFVLPGLILIGIWIYWPLLQTFWLSFFSGSLTKGPTDFVGLRNYAEVLALPEFQTSLINTLLYIAGLIPLAVVLPMFVAIILSKVRGPLQVLYRSVLFTPVIMAPVVVSLIWLWILNPIQGVLNRVLGQLFGLNNINWLNDSSTAIWVVVLITTWKIFGFSLILFLAAVVGIDREYQEAARIDGASDFALIRYIIFPLITPTFYFLVIYTVLFAGQWAFGPVNVLTQGGPRNTTTNVYYILYQFGFEFFNIGYASAAAVMLFVVLGIGMFIAVRFTDRKAHYES
jgi:multiple sugar transport system permease protein